MQFAVIMVADEPLEIHYFLLFFKQFGCLVSDSDRRKQASGL